MSKFIIVPYIKSRLGVCRKALVTEAKFLNFKSLLQVVAFLSLTIRLNFLMCGRYELLWNLTLAGDTSGFTVVT